MENEDKKPATRKKPVAVKQIQGIEKKIIKRIFIGVFVFMIIVALDQSYKFTSAFRNDIQTKSKWQAVFLSNDQVYFGHLSQYGINYWRLDNAHYIKVTKVPVAPSAAQDPKAKTNSQDQQPQFENRTSLVKLSDDMHEPENTLYIPKENILFWQDLQNSSSIVQTLVAEGGR